MCSQAYYVRANNDLTTDHIHLGNRVAIRPRASHRKVARFGSCYRVVHNRVVNFFRVDPLGKLEQGVKQKLVPLALAYKVKLEEMLKKKTEDLIIKAIKVRKFE
jgi:hypothetical protein